jgi:hypothetical protein
MAAMGFQFPAVSCMQLKENKKGTMLCVQRTSPYLEGVQVSNQLVVVAQLAFDRGGH